MSYVIYCIIDPRDERPFYIGRTGNFELRKRQHLDGGHGASGVRIAEILDNRLVPLFVRLEDCSTRAQAYRTETFWIEVLTSRNIPILNKQNKSAKGPLNAGMRWDKADDDLLDELVAADMPTPQIASRLQRTISAIERRIEQKGL